jgi:hypothetical protein
MSVEFPPELKRFLDQHIDSLGALETLFLLHRDRERLWDVAEVAKALYISTDMCARQLAHLKRQGFVATARDGERFQFAPANATVDRLIGELAAIYPQRRVTVITLIYSKPQDTVRTFADAFRLRRED